MTQDDFSIEPLSQENFPEFVWLIRELARFEKLDPPDAEAEARLKAHGLGDRPYYTAFVARSGEEAIGYIIYFLSYSSFLAKPTLYLEDIFLLEKHRKKGYGKRMFLFCVEAARGLDCGRMEWSALNWNKNAIDFYLSLGAKPLSEWTYYRMTEDVMQKALEKKR